MKHEAPEATEQEDATKIMKEQIARRSNKVLQEATKSNKKNQKATRINRWLQETRNKIE